VAPAGKGRSAREGGRPLWGESRRPSSIGIASWPIILFKFNMNPKLIFVSVQRVTLSVNLKHPGVLLRLVSITGLTYTETHQRRRIKRTNLARL